jgi:PAT family beta-lactamase induction signal transducer AmpG
MFTTSLGVGRALWIFGFLQAISNIGYAVVAELGVNVPVMYAAIAIEAGTTGMGTGAFSVLLLRLTQRRFSATQYALFSSLFALGRTVSGPPAGALIDAIGWRDFFLLTIVLAAPGLAMLQRFVPWGVRDVPPQPDEEAEPPPAGAPVSHAGLAARGLVAAVVATFGGFLTSALLVALRTARGDAPFDLATAVTTMLHPARGIDYIDLVGPPVLGLAVGLATAAYVAARRGIAPR